VRPIGLAGVLLSLTLIGAPLGIAVILLASYPFYRLVRRRCDQLTAYDYTDVWAASDGADSPLVGPIDMKFTGLNHHLRCSTTPRVTLTFTEIEGLNGGASPRPRACTPRTGRTAARTRRRGQRRGTRSPAPDVCPSKSASSAPARQLTARTRRCHLRLGRRHPLRDAGGGAPTGAPDAVLVGCVKLKGDHPVPAEDLYVSPLFLKRREYAESSGLPGSS